MQMIRYCLFSLVRLYELFWVLWCHIYSFIIIYCLETFIVKIKKAAKKGNLRENMTDKHEWIDLTFGHLQDRLNHLWMWDCKKSLNNNSARMKMLRLHEVKESKRHSPFLGLSPSEQSSVSPQRSRGQNTDGSIYSRQTFGSQVSHRAFGGAYLLEAHDINPICM